MALLTRSDIVTALRRLGELALERSEDPEVCWALIEPYVIPSQALKARYAFLDLWESSYDNH